MYVVYHKPSELYLPPRARTYKGATQATLGKIPRLFSRMRDAVSAARWWAKGITRVHIEQDVTGGYDELWETTPIEDRKLSDLRVFSVAVVRVGVLIKIKEQQ